MDAEYFLGKRLALIRSYYEEAAQAFLEKQRKIENAEPPFDNPPYDESGEPPFLEEWMNASTAIEVLGLSSVSMLSDSVKLYFQAVLGRVLGYQLTEEEKRKAKKEGFVAAYRSALGCVLQTDWKACPADFEIIEQVVLARNGGQHGECVTSFHVPHDRRTLQRFPRPFFASDDEWQSWVAGGGHTESLIRPSINISRGKLFSAIDEVQKLASWIETRIQRGSSEGDAG